jgi:DmsE family decaheme c-type cytochrome
MIHRSEFPLHPTLARAALLVAAALCACGVAWADGTSDCVGCHENISKMFETTVHGRIAEFETLDGRTGCVTCHGEGTEHMESGGEEKIRSFKKDTPPEEAVEVCRSCHRSYSLHDWEASQHALNGVTCASCHQAHVDPAQERKMVKICSDCHADVWAQFHRPSHHPVREGHMDCGACHHPHGTTVDMLHTDERPAELCLSCHPQFAGPFLFEHEPVYEGCETCHHPHGAAADHLLVQNQPFLCLQCHELHFHAALEGEEDDQAYVPRYDPANGAADGVTYPGGLVPNPWGEQGYKRAYTTKCTQCHTQVHGSDQPSQTVSGRGQGLAR